MQEFLIATIEESDADARLSSTSSSTRSVNVGLGVLGRLKLNDKLDIWDVKASGGDIGRNENLELGIFESFNSDLSLVLSDITVHHLNVVGDLVRKQ